MRAIEKYVSASRKVGVTQTELFKIASVTHLSFYNVRSVRAIGVASFCIKRSPNVWSSGAVNISVEPTNGDPAQHGLAGDEKRRAWMESLLLNDALLHCRHRSVVEQTYSYRSDVCAGHDGGEQKSCC